MTVTIDLRSSHLFKLWKICRQNKSKAGWQFVYMDLINTTIAKQYTEHACSDLRQHFWLRHGKFNENDQLGTHHRICKIEEKTLKTTTKNLKLIVH